MCFLATLLRLMYILSFLAINALKTQKNGRLLYVLLRESRHVPLRCAFGGRKMWFVYIICTHKKHTHIFSHCPTFLHTQSCTHIHF